MEKKIGRRPLFAPPTNFLSPNGGGIEEIQ